jgi:hypothetical protein
MIRGHHICAGLPPVSPGEIAQVARPAAERALAGGVGERVELAPIGLAGNQLKSEDLLKAAGPAPRTITFLAFPDAKNSASQ